MEAKIQFGIDLKKRVIRKQSVVDIGRWAHSVYLDLDCEDDKFLDLLLHLNTMELGPEFAIAYEKLEQVADDLILSNKVKL